MRKLVIAIVLSLFVYANYNIFVTPAKATIVDFVIVVICIILASIISFKQQSEINKELNDNFRDKFAKK
jgi:hypothetical protein